MSCQNGECGCGCGNTLHYIIHNDEQPTRYAKGDGWKEPPSRLLATPRGTIAGANNSPGGGSGIPPAKHIDANRDAAATSTPPKRPPAGDTLNRQSKRDDSDSPAVREFAAKIIMELRGRISWADALLLARRTVESESYSRARTSEQPHRYADRPATSADVAEVIRRADAALAGPSEAIRNEALQIVERRLNSYARNGITVDSRGMFSDEVAKLTAKRYGRSSVTPDDVVAYATRQIERGRIVSYAEAAAELAGA